MERKLAAILAADVVGYSRLMESDEAGTMAVLRVRRRDVLAPLVAKQHGRIFKTTGDGVLVEFASAVNAVQCAVDLQQEMATANDGQLENAHRELALARALNPDLNAATFRNAPDADDALRCHLLEGLRKVGLAE
jgi:class 3 adenylate cyclase